MNPEDIFLSKKKRNYKIIKSIGPILSVMLKLLVILDKGAGPNFLSEDQLTPFL